MFFIISLCNLTYQQNSEHQLAGKVFRNWLGDLVLSPQCQQGKPNKGLNLLSLFSWAASLHPGCALESLGELFKISNALASFGQKLLNWSEVGCSIQYFLKLPKRYLRLRTLHTFIMQRQGRLAFTQLSSAHPAINRGFLSYCQSHTTQTSPGRTCLPTRPGPALATRKWQHDLCVSELQFYFSIGPNSGGDATNFHP